MESEEKSKLIGRFIIIAIMIAVVSSGLTYYFVANEPELTLTKSEYSEDSNENLQRILSTLKNFRGMINRYYLGEIDEEKVLNETLKGYVNGLDDEYSEYMTAEEWDEFQSDALGNYVGIGIYMSVDGNGNTVVLEPIKGSPAEEVGILSNDIIAEVNGENVLGMDIDEVSNKVKGEAGTKVKIKVLRGEELFDFEVKREAIKVYHVESKMLENNIGYLQLATFDEGCANEFEKSYKELKDQGMQKLIIDLRNNTGGLVDEALEILDMIIPKGENVLITVNADGKKEYTKANGGNFVDMEIVVLTNEFSASASEIVAGALKDNGKATIVGEKTYGKGVIQNVYMISDGSVLKLTVSEYYTPNEVKIHKLGIEPDVVVELQKDGNEDSQLKKAIEILNEK